MMLTHTNPDGTTNGFQSWFLHAERESQCIAFNAQNIPCQPGQMVSVKRGDQIGRIGDIGAPKHFHLHYEVRRSSGSGPVDPLVPLSQIVDPFGCVDSVIQTDPSACIGTLWIDPSKQSFTYTYVTHDFGPDINSNVWNIWSATGSNIWDFTYNYIGGYLHYAFKIYDYSGFYCSASCRLHVIFDRNPTSGFNAPDVLNISASEFPESSQNNHIYDASIQWNANGYHVSVYDETTASEYSDTDYPVSSPTGQIFDAFGSYVQWAVDGYPPSQSLYTSIDDAEFAADFSASIYGADITGTNGGGSSIATMPHAVHIATP
jgi:hypothetical protein